MCARSGLPGLYDGSHETVLVMFMFPERIPVEGRAGTGGNGGKIAHDDELLGIGRDVLLCSAGGHDL